MLWNRGVTIWFWRTCRNCFAKHPKVFSQRPENKKSITICSLQKHQFASKCCSRNAKCSFDNTGKTFLGGSPRNFSSKSEKDKRVFVVNEKKIFVLNFSCEVTKSSSKQPFRKFSAQKLTRNQKPFIFVPEKIPKFYLWTRRMKFWQQC